MTAAEADRLARENLGRCARLARKATLRCPRLREEAESVALLGLAHAIRSHDPARGPFEPYVHTVIRREIFALLLNGEQPKGYRVRDGVRRKRRPAVVPLSMPPAASDDVDMEWEETVHALARLLPPRHAELVRLCYIRADCRSIGSLARRMGLSTVRAYAIHREAMTMLGASPAARRILSA